MPCLEIMLAPGQELIGEAGAMCYMQQGIEMSTKFDDGSDPTGAREGYAGICTWKTYKRTCMAGESCTVVFFKNESEKEPCATCSRALRCQQSSTMGRTRLEHG